MSAWLRRFWLLLGVHGRALQDDCLLLVLEELSMALSPQWHHVVVPEFCVSIHVPASDGFWLLSGSRTHITNPMPMVSTIAKKLSSLRYCGAETVS